MQYEFHYLTAYRLICVYIYIYVTTDWSTLWHIRMLHDVMQDQAKFCVLGSGGHDIFAASVANRQRTYRLIKSIYVLYVAKFSYDLCLLLTLHYFQFTSACALFDTA